MVCFFIVFKNELPLYLISLTAKLSYEIGKSQTLEILDWVTDRCKCYN